MITEDRSPRAILLLWSPLALQWLMMAIEGPFLAAVIARLPDPTINLAAYGVAYAFAILVESPVIMLMSASTALAEDSASYRRLRVFAAGLNAFATALLLLVLIPPVFDQVMEGLIGVPAEVAHGVYGALWLLLPWPAAIGYRRFLHGLLIRSGRTRRVAYGTLVRLAAMATAAGALAAGGMPGAWVGAGALTAGVLAEAVAARLMAAGTVREVLATPAAGGAGSRAESPTRSHDGVVPAEGAAAGGTESPPGSRGAAVPAAAAAAGGSDLEAYAAITRFYYPLALTSFIALTVQPMLTFFMGRAPSPIESLAVFPVVHSLVFLFTCLGLSYQEAVIALVGRRYEHAPALGRFGTRLGIGASAALAVVAFTPLAGVWFERVSGLAPHLAAIAVSPIRFAVLLPALSVALAFQRALLVQTRTTRPITHATMIEVAAIALLFPLFGWWIGLTGVTAAMLAFVGGRSAGVAFLAPRTVAAVRAAR